ncbi:MAG: lactate racemase domain-containing protein [Betaproteobacteria bacterium]|nr:lactate racemase domain-containing protein [Betaproteobacteria bacterium]
MIGQGHADRYLARDEIRAIVREGLDSLRPDGKRLLFIIPDGTRTMPMPEMFALFREALAGRARQVDFLVALGTHQPMSDAALSQLVGEQVVDGRVGASRIFNHRWDDPATFATIGTIPAGEIAQLSGGRMTQDVPVALNRLIFDYDQLVICGPVFPHEVVGFSGGNKYFFPGIAAADVINFTHWLGALITNYDVIGAGYTPVRAVIDRAASLVTVPTACFALVVTPQGLAGLYFGPAREAWERASALSSQRHIVWVDRPFRRVLSVMPPMYADLWTAGKGMYKIEPAVADGGEVVIYAPHIREVSFTHGHLIDAIGYHCRDYFTAQPERFAGYPGGVVAHSTHVKGLGTYDAATGVETPRVTVTLATGIPEERCRRINLGYRDPATIDVAQWQGREAEGILYVPRAGEMLYRVRKSADTPARQSATLAT